MGDWFTGLLAFRSYHPLSSCDCSSFFFLIFLIFIIECILGFLGSRFIHCVVDMKCSSSKEVELLDQKGLVETIKDKDGIQQLMIQSPKGASVLVRFQHYSLFPLVSDRSIYL